jgi:hypothetical protein
MKEKRLFGAKHLKKRRFLCRKNDFVESKIQKPKKSL